MARDGHAAPVQGGCGGRSNRQSHQVRQAQGADYRWLESRRVEGQCDTLVT